MRRPALLAIAGCLLLLNFAAAQEPRGLVYDFSATWCGPCQQVAPVVEKLEREGLPIRKVDIDQRRDLANQFQVQQIPTFVLVVDGKEVDRVSGRLTEADLRRMIARIPASTPAVAAPASAPATPMSIPVQLGEPAGLPRPQPLESQPQETRVVEAEPRKGLRDLLPFNRKSEPPPAVVRGNDSGLASTEAPAPSAAGDAALPADPMASSVRIRVITNGRIDLGSGTVISSRPGITQILTCAHIFKEFSDDSRIEVDLFEHGQGVQYLARLIHFDAKSDLGLVSIPTSGVVPTIKVAPRPSAPRVGEPVAAIGCSGGEEPTRQQLRVTDIDKYDGPNNVLCTGVPVRGRSGGGLFNRHGEIIGVCSAADEAEQRGFYSGLFAIHKLLDDCSLTSLYETPPAPASTPERELISLAAVPAAAAQPSPEPAPSSAIVPVAPAERNPVDVQAGDAEVVVIIRDRSRPEAPNRVVIIHEASPKFYSYLSGELGSGGGHTEVLGKNENSSSKQVLRPTGLSQPVAPQKYVRSAESR